MCGCKRIRTVRSSMKIGGDHMFSEVSAERFVCRARTSPFCPSPGEDHINPVLLESEDTTPLLHPSGGDPLCWFFMLKL
jgi:hypothetical protein